MTTRTFLLIVASIGAGLMGGLFFAFRAPWTLWNHVRTVSCALAAAAFAITPLL